MSLKKKITAGMRAFEVFNTLFLIFIASLCILPIVHILAVSLSSNNVAAANMVKFWPVEFTMNSYIFVLARKAFWNAFGISLQRVALGTIINNVLIVMMAYPLSKSNKEFPGRNIFMYSILFVMMFSGGLVPTYILVRNLKLLDSIWSLILPGAVPIFSVILVMNFIKQLPYEIEEAAFVDGASYFVSLTRIILPLSMPVLATITLFNFVGHWNSWFDGLVFMTKVEKYPLQTFLRLVVENRDIRSFKDLEMFGDTNDRTIKSAQLFITIVPILLIYPLLQKHFTSGIVIGAVKG